MTKIIGLPPYLLENMKLYPTAEEKDKVDNLVKTKLKTKVVGIAPGGAVNPGQVAIIKRWPLSHYKLLAKKLISKNYQIVVIGGNDDISINKWFDNKRKVHNLTGKLNIRESYYLLSRYCKIFVVHDSGPMHLAAAAKVPKLITLFGPTQPERFAPHNAVVIQSPTHKPCYTIQGKFTNKKGGMEIISVEEVLKHIK